MVTGGARGQKIPKAVREALNAIQSQRGPRGRYKEAVDGLARTQTEIGDLEAKAQSVSDLLLALASNRRELKDAQGGWDDAAHRAEIEWEREKRTAAATVAAELERTRHAARLARERADTMRGALDDRTRTIAELGELGTRRELIDEEIATARVAKDEAKATLVAAEGAVTQLRDGMKENATLGRRLERIHAAVALNSEIQRHQVALDQASILGLEEIRLSEAIAAISATDEKVVCIEEALTAKAGADAAANAVSTTVAFEIPDDQRGRIRVGPRPLGGEEKKLAILELTDIAIEGLGSIVVEPRIKDLATLLKGRQTAEDALAAVLDAAGATDLAAAREAAARRREHVRMLAQVRKDLSNVAPGNPQKTLAPGLDALRTHVSTLRGTLRAEQEALALAALPQEDDLAAEIASARADGDRLASEAATRESALAGPRTVLADSESLLRRHEDALTALAATIGTRNSDLVAARASRSDDGLAEQAAQLERDAQEKERDHVEREKSPGESVDAIDARIKRLEAASTNHHNVVAKLTLEITRLTALIQAQEGLGIEEQILGKQAELDRLSEVVAGYEQESAVLQLLLETLENAERDAKNRYLAPVVERVQPYLKMILPDSNIVFDENLGVSGLQREGQTEDYDVLSGGTQEQLAVLSRIAFAELLLSQKRPATVILDDALAFSDDDRIENMFDVLVRAGEKVQIIVLTCRKRLFSRLGAAPLEIRKMA